MFGTNHYDCDVLLGSRGRNNISNRHFCITFDEQRRVILKDSSTWGTTVSYGGQAGEETRHHFTWILSLDENRYKNIIVYVPESTGLAFRVELAIHEIYKREYVENIDQFLEESRAALPKSRAALPPLDVLSIYSDQTTAAPSEPLSPRQPPIYLRDRVLGSGAFGRVNKVIDVSTGSIYAGKEFYRSYQQERNKQKRAQQKQD